MTSPAKMRLLSIASLHRARPGSLPATEGPPVDGASARGLRRLQGICAAGRSSADTRHRANCSTMLRRSKRARYPTHPDRKSDVAPRFAHRLPFRSPRPAGAKVIAVTLLTIGMSANGLILGRYRWPQSVTMLHWPAALRRRSPTPRADALHDKIYRCVAGLCE